MRDYQEFIHRSRYARWLDDEQRRETWEETVRRYITALQKQITKVAGNDEYTLNTSYILEEAILNKEVMPSMRALMTSGPALDRDNVAAYNCAFMNINRVRAFDELLYILMCGVGVGFSVERQHISRLPIVAEEFYETDTTIHVRDSKIGWAAALRELVALLYSGQIPKWDLSKVRAAGERLKTFGGRASGPEPLDRLFRQLVRIFTNAAGRRLNSIECHDICCYVADAVIAGGVRRSALLSLSNLTDQRMRSAKSGDWWNTNPQRAYANNSVAYTEKPDMGIFIEEFKSLYDSKSGERGIFNRIAANEKASSSGRREEYSDFGCNPCSEIILRDREFCNLTEVIIRPTDNYEDLIRKIEIATIIGTIQSTLTDFKYISNKWKENCEEERLLGVSLTGIMDHPVMSGGDVSLFSGWNGPESLEDVLEKLRWHAIDVNKKWAEILGINQSAAITCVKPSGTVSQLVGCSSGIHPAHYRHYIRTVRNSARDPISKFLIDQGVPYEEAIGNSSTLVFSFPMKAADNAVLADNVSALQQLRIWKTYNDHWCEHKPSCTILVKEHEWMEVGAWVYKNFDDISGISFLPHDDHIYQQAPYQRISEEEYNNKIKTFPAIDWSKFNSDYERTDNTTGSQEYACVGNQCEIV